MSVELGILGAGNMAEAIAGGVVRGGILPPSQILASDVSAARRDVFTRTLGIRAVDDNRHVARDARILLLSVKPQQMGDVLTGIADAIDPKTLLVSIAAGITTRFIESRLGEGRGWRIVRAMPNTPMLVGEGIVGLARGRHASEQDAALARKLFQGAAAVIDVREEQLDTVTAVSGSGPAYFFFLVEQMIRAGVELGLAPEQARQLTIKTALGAARMLAQSTDNPEELRRKVTSPGGTTQAALSYMEQHEFAGIIVEAIKAAQRRSKELAG